MIGQHCAREVPSSFGRVDAVFHPRRLSLKMELVGEGLLSFVGQILIDKFHDKISDSAEEVTERAVGKLLAKECDEIKIKLEGLSRKDLLAGVEFLKQGILSLNQMLKKTSELQKATRKPEGAVDVGAEKSFSDGMEIFYKVEGFRVAALCESALNSFGDAIKRFSSARMKATEAFSNDSLSVHDRIRAVSIQVRSQYTFTKCNLQILPSRTNREIRGRCQKDYIWLYWMDTIEREMKLLRFPCSECMWRCYRFVLKSQFVISEAKNHKFWCHGVLISIIFDNMRTHFRTFLGWPCVCLYTVEWLEFLVVTGKCLSRKKSRDNRPTKNKLGDCFIELSPDCRHFAGESGQTGRCSAGMPAVSWEFAHHSNHPNGFQGISAEDLYCFHRLFLQKDDCCNYPINWCPLPDYELKSILFNSYARALRPNFTYLPAALPFLLMRVIDDVRETIADVSSACPSSDARNVSYCLPHGVYYPHQHSVDTPVCLPPRRRSYLVLLRAGIIKSGKTTLGNYLK